MMQRTLPSVRLTTPSGFACISSVGFMICRHPDCRIVDAARRFVFRSPLVSLCSHRKLLVEVVGSRNDAARKCGLLVVEQSGMTKVVAECVTKVNS